MSTVIRKSLGIFLVFAAFSPLAQAAHFTPEIDPGSAASALTMCAGGMMLMIDRFYRRK
jgi:hypothetical protein